MLRLIIICLAFVVMALQVATNVLAQEYPLESQTISGTATGLFHTEMIGNRWWLIAPDGKGNFTRAVSLLDTTNGSDYPGGFRSYDAVALAPAVNPGRTISHVNVTSVAEDSNPGDVVLNGVTLHSVGDQIIFGSSRFLPEYTFFQLSRLGAGGTVKWYYLGDGQTWKLINGNGKPYQGTALKGGNYNLDVGGQYYGVATNGFQISNSPTSERITWFPTGSAGVKTWPTDFTSRVISGIDRVPRYYLKGMVATAFSTAPILSQMYERATVDELVEAKYGGSFPTPYVRWANNTIAKLVGWGFNAAGQYSYRYDEVHNLAGDGGIKVTNRVPSLLVIQVSDLVMRAGETYVSSPIKNVYANVGQEAVCAGQWQGRIPDVFDPNYQSAIDGVVAKLANPVDASYVYALVPEEADDLYGLNSLLHQHLGFTVLASNPYMTQDTVNAVTYGDPVLYSKLALRDFLKSRYDDSVAALDAAWGTSYTTWDTSSGDVTDGTNAYGVGTGLLDENGSHIFFPLTQSCRAGTQIQYNNSFTNPSYPAVRRDLDDFVAYFASAYARQMNQALGQLTSRPPIFSPLYSAPTMVYQATASYVDGFWINPGLNSGGGSCVSFDPVCTAADLDRIYRAAQKPLIVADYATATSDSQIGVAGAESALSYNSARNQSTVTVAGMKYWLAMGNTLNFANAKCPPSIAYPVPGAVLWSAANGTQLTLGGNYSSCIAAGSQVSVIRSNTTGEQIAVDFPTQPARADAIISRWSAVLNYQGPDHVFPVVGLEHWSLYDEVVNEYATPPGQYGLFTVNDNPYDGVSDATGTRTDAAGYLSGGEEGSYGNLLSGSGGLGSWMTTIYKLIQ